MVAINQTKADGTAADMLNNHFEVDKRGLAKLLERRGLAYISDSTSAITSWLNN